MDPTSIGRYQIVRRLGRGGMGTLFLARDPGIDRLVAIKMLREDLDNEDLVQRFEREARIAGALRHPNIVTIFDVGTEGGHPFIAMEYITGETVQAVIQERRQLSVARRLGWIEQLCSGLHYAHRAGVIHRDIKPANLMIDAEGQLKILDFGIARHGESEMTRTGMVVGTLHYMAPEQIESRAVDARADVFGVGAVAYELLSYKRAFPGDVPSAVMRKILTGTFEPLALVCPSLDGDIAPIVTRCLENDPNKRWSGLETVRQQLAVIRRRIADEVADTNATTGWRSAPAPIEAAPETPASRREIDRRRLDPDDSAAVELEEQAHAARRRLSSPSSPPHSVELRPRDQRGGPGRTLIWATAAIVFALAAVVVLQRWGRAAEPVEPVASNRALVTANAGADPAAAVVSPTDGPASVRTSTPVAPTTPSTPSRAKVEPAPPQRTDAGSRATSTSQEAALGSIQATQAACERGDGGMCFELGVSYRTGRGAGVDHLRATGLFERACDDGFARGCNAVGIAYARGLGVARDDARAAALYQRGCDNGYGSACVNLGRMYEGAQGVPKDDGRAGALFGRGCEGGDGAGCNDAGRMYEFGRGVAKDEARAATLYQRACANGYAPGCSSFGWMYFRGVGIDRDEARAVALFRQSCDAGSSAGCNNLGLAYFQGRGIAKDVKRAAELYQQSCNQDGTVACTSLGLMYLRGQDIPRDDERAATLFRRACDRDQAGGCFNLGFVYATGRGVMKDESRAVTLYQRACDAGIGDACTRAASMYEQGLGVAADRARAAALYQRGRDLIGGGTTQRPPPPETKADGGAPGDGRTGGGPQLLRVGGAIKAPTKLKDVRPTYPVAAQYARAQGVVVIEATIGPSGNVAQTKILQSIPLLDGAAEDAVKQWQYTPTIVDGKAVPVVMTVTVNFSLQDGAPK